MKNEIYHEGQSLRKKIMSIYKDKYRDKEMNILIYSPDNGAWKYDFMIWKDVFEFMGIKVTMLYEIDNKTLYKNFDVFISIAEKSYINNILNNPSVNNIPYKIGLASKRMCTSDNNSTEDLYNLDLITNDFKFHFLISSFSEKSISFVFKEWIKKGVEIKSIPFGFNPLIHYPENVEETYDYFFVGTNSYLKIDETKRYLLPIISKYKGVLRGKNWGGSIPELNYKNVRQFYNRARININYHLKLQKQYENEINERTFIISACGGFQLVDNPKILSKYYTEKEIAIANDEKEYLKKFEYYLNKPMERHEMAYEALIKTYNNNCSIFHRLEKIINYICE